MSTESHSTGLLSLSFSNSLQDGAIECLSDILEVKLDSMLDDGILKDIPFISTAISIYRIGHTIHDRHYLKKLAIFIDQINRGIQDETVRQAYIERFQKNQKSCNQELEYVLILVDYILSGNIVRHIVQAHHWDTETPWQVTNPARQRLVALIVLSVAKFDALPKYLFPGAEITCRTCKGDRRH